MSSVDSILFDMGSKENIECCPTCGNKCVKSGKRYNKFGSVQKYRCTACGTTHSDGNDKRVYPDVIRQYGIELYKNGQSLAEAAQSIEDNLNVKLARQTILKWLQKEEIPRRKPKPRTKKEKTEIVEKSFIEIKISVQLVLVNTQTMIAEHIETYQLDTLHNIQKEERTKVIAS